MRHLQESEQRWRFSFNPSLANRNNCHSNFRAYQDQQTFNSPIWWKCAFSGDNLLSHVYTTPMTSGLSIWRYNSRIHDLNWWFWSCQVFRTDTLTCFNLIFLKLQVHNLESFPVSNSHITSFSKKNTQWVLIPCFLFFFNNFVLRGFPVWSHDHHIWKSYDPYYLWYNGDLLPACFVTTCQPNKTDFKEIIASQVRVSL